MSEHNDILDLNFNDEVDIVLVEAEKGKRFANYIVDILIFMAGFFILIIVFAALNENFMLWADYLDENPIIDRIFTALCMTIYYFIVETTLKGKTVGKYITKTRVVNFDGSVPSANTFFLRSLSRIVPFEAFSFLGEKKNGWHDRWTDTMVIDEKLSRL